MFLLIVAVFPFASTAQEYYRKNKIIIKDMGDSVRAMESFGGSRNGGTWYSDAVNEYARELADVVKVYSMLIPTSTEYYSEGLPEGWSNPQTPVIRNIFAHMCDTVIKVDITDTLGKHIDEPIYARTDHHWFPLGAYYAAQVFAKTADVPFLPLEEYTPVVIKDYIGSMYRFSKDPKVKECPENFIYYKPKNENCTTTFVGHNMKRGKVTGITAPYQGDFFFKYDDGSGYAYCTFMGGDSRTTHVETDVNNGRKLMIIKDSYGNALPGYLFSSFEDIYVVDFRYFTKNIIDYISENEITDLLFVNNIQHAYAKSTANAFIKMFNQ